MKVAHKKHLLSCNTANWAKQEAAFKKRWLALSHRPPAVFRVRNSKTDWKRLFEQLKKLAEDDDTTTVFAAGDAKFVRQARSYVPSVIRFLPVVLPAILTKELKAFFWKI